MAGHVRIHQREKCATVSKELLDEIVKQVRYNSITANGARVKAYKSYTHVML